MNFLFRGGPHRLEEKGREKKEGGCAFPHWLCSQLRRALRDSTAEHGVHFCHRLRKVTRKNRSIWGEKNSQSGIKYRRVRKVQTSPSVCVWRWEREEAYTGNSDFHTPWTHWDSKTEKASCWTPLHRPGVSNLNDLYALQKPRTACVESLFGYVDTLLCCSKVGLVEAEKVLYGSSSQSRVIVLFNNLHKM